ncbi:hypothetical protein, partial [Escherichia coli]|uniref:hypothetical protein n=1 Tax=Escherichia coli TaxID=562 RepID=UPI0010CC1D8F
PPPPPPPPPPQRLLVDHACGNLFWGGGRGGGGRRTIHTSRLATLWQSHGNPTKGNVGYTFGRYNDPLRNGGSNTSSYLSLNNVTALREHHGVLDGSLYG